MPCSISAAAMSSGVSVVRGANDPEAAAATAARSTCPVEMSSAVCVAISAPAAERAASLTARAATTCSPGSGR
jgi:hypothetical protein